MPTKVEKSSLLFKELGREQRLKGAHSTPLIQWSNQIPFLSRMRVDEGKLLCTTRCSMFHSLCACSLAVQNMRGAEGAKCFLSKLGSGPALHLEQVQ